MFCRSSDAQPRRPFTSHGLPKGCEIITSRSNEFSQATYSCFYYDRTTVTCFRLLSVTKRRDDLLCRSRAVGAATGFNHVQCFHVRDASPAALVLPPWYVLSPPKMSQRAAAEFAPVVGCQRCGAVRELRMSSAKALALKAGACVRVGVRRWNTAW